MGRLSVWRLAATLLVQGAIIFPFLVQVVVHVESYPMVQNNSALMDAEQRYADGLVTPDDLAVSSEEDDEEEVTLNFPFSFSDDSVSASHSSSTLKTLTDYTNSHEQVSGPLISDVEYSQELNSPAGEWSKEAGSKGKTGGSNTNDTYRPVSLRHGRSFKANPATASEISNNSPISMALQVGPTTNTAIGDAPMAHKLDNESGVKITGLSIDYDSDKRRVDYDDEGSPIILEGLEVKLTLYGKFTPMTYFRLSKLHVCDDLKNEEEPQLVKLLDDEWTVGVVHVTMPRAGELNRVYLCLKTDEDPNWHRQGESKTGRYGLPIKPWLVIKLTTSMFPVLLHLLLIVLLLTLSGLFSGLNLGLMSLDKTDLKIIMNTGSKSERDYASSIAPVRNHGNFLLCCLLFSNVLVNATLTILVDDLTSGLIAIAGSTLAIVIFGEIIPQAICSRYGLAVGARTIYITKFFMLVTSPLAYPLSKLLDRILGEEIGNVYTRERLKELLEVTRDKHGLEPEEVGIISGALDLKTKTVKDVMVKLDQIFMLPSDAVLDFETMAEIEYQGYSRIPVYDGERSNVVALINVKQLTLLDASDNIPLRLIMDYYKTSLFFVFENTHLDFMFKAFREGSRGHMAFVQRVNDDGDGDPFYETVGMLTMEDVLEEILQTDIKDENDFEKSKPGQPKSRPSMPFKEKKKPRRTFVEIPATLCLAASQYLSTSVAPFKDGRISTHIIQRLLKANVHLSKAPKRRGRSSDPEVYLFEAGLPSDSFIMILEGRVNVTVGTEKLMYEAGPFVTFGNDFLMNPHLGAGRSITLGESTLSSPTDLDPSERPSITSELADVKGRATFIPDYSVKVVTDCYHLRLKYDTYRHALAATELERVYNENPENMDVNNELQQEIEKALDNEDDEDDVQAETKKMNGLGEALERENSKPNVLVNGLVHKRRKADKRISTLPVTDESDNSKDTEADESHPTEVTKLLQNNLIISNS